MNEFRTDIAWAAGLFEGEGCISVAKESGHRVNHPYPRATLAMTDRDVVERFANIIPSGRFYIDVQQRHPDSKPVHHYVLLGFEKTQALIAMFWPWLGERRREKAIDVLMLCRTHARRRERNPS